MHGQSHGGVAKAVEALPRQWGRGQSRGVVDKAVGAQPKALEAWPRPCRRRQGRGGVVKAVWPFPSRGGVAKALGAGSRPWWRGQVFRRVAKAVGALEWTWQHCQGSGGVAKAVRSNPNPNPKAVEA